MTEPEPTQGGFLKSLGRFLDTSRAVVQNRLELFAVELQQEQHRLMGLLFLAGSALLLALLAVSLFTGVIIFLFPAPYRLYIAVGLGLVYLTGTFLLCRAIGTLLEPVPFSESINQIQKDVQCFTVPKERD